MISNNRKSPFNVFYLPQGQVTTTACANYCESVLRRYVDLGEGGKPECPEKNSRSTVPLNKVCDSIF